jgi:hypothetical protein
LTCEGIYGGSSSAGIALIQKARRVCYASFSISDLRLCQSGRPVLAKKLLRGIPQRCTEKTSMISQLPAWRTDAAGGGAQFKAAVE